MIYDEEDEDIEWDDDENEDGIEWDEDLPEEEP